jgi:RNA-directed DNA polymerase
MPLGNLTSQFFANVYLNELDYFVKQKLKVKYYIRYVDDFIILHKSKSQLAKWKEEIEVFLKEKLNLELHPEKSKIINLSRGVDFVGFRTFYHHKLLRERNIRKIKQKIKEYKENKISQEKFVEILNGWNAYSKWSNNYNLKKSIFTNP